MGQICCIAWKGGIVQMKGFGPRRIRSVFMALLLLGALLAALAASTGVDGLGIAGVVLIAGAFVLSFVLYRCPHCGAYLGRGFGSHCQHCGERIDT